MRNTKRKIDTGMPQGGSSLQARINSSGTEENFGYGHWMSDNGSSSFHGTHNKPANLVNPINFLTKNRYFDQLNNRAASGSAQRIKSIESNEKLQRVSETRHGRIESVEGGGTMITFKREGNRIKVNEEYQEVQRRTQRGVTKQRSLPKLDMYPGLASHQRKDNSGVAGTDGNQNGPGGTFSPEEYELSPGGVMSRSTSTQRKTSVSPSKVMKYRTTRPHAHSLKESTDLTTSIGGGGAPQRFKDGHFISSSSQVGAVGGVLSKIDAEKSTALQGGGTGTQKFQSPFVLKKTASAASFQPRTLSPSSEQTIFEPINRSNRAHLNQIHTNQSPGRFKSQKLLSQHHQQQQQRDSRSKSPKTTLADLRLSYGNEVSKYDPEDLKMPSRQGKRVFGNGNSASVSASTATMTTMTVTSTTPSVFTAPSSNSMVDLSNSDALMSSLNFSPAKNLNKQPLNGRKLAIRSHNQHLQMGTGSLEFGTKMYPSYKLSKRIQQKLSIGNQNGTTKTAVASPSIDESMRKVTGFFAECDQVVKKISFSTRKGQSSSNPLKPNQDNYSIGRDFAQFRNQVFLSVCDGHGSNGHLVSDFLTLSLPQTISTKLIAKCVEKEAPKTENSSVSASPSRGTPSKKLGPVKNFQFQRKSDSATLPAKEATSEPKLRKEGIPAVLVEAFLECNQRLSSSLVDVSCSGSTCVSILVHGTDVWCANVGDSRAVVGRKKGDTWFGASLSRDHKPTDADEHERVIKSGGRVEPSRKPNGQYVGPERVWLKNQPLPGLAMTRSFGDKIAARVGVLAEPEIKKLKLGTDDRFIVLASDGVWEQMSNLEVVKLVSIYYELGDSQKAADELVARATAYWRKNDQFIDDITCVVAFLDSSVLQQATI